MATRFGSSWPRAAYVARLKWLVGGLVSVIFILLGTLISLAHTDQKVEDTAPKPVQLAAAASSPAVDILAALGRIEAGAELNPSMFGRVTLPVDQIPLGAVLARDSQFVLGKFAVTLINSNQPLTADALSNYRPLNFFQGKIPPGFRAVTIKADIQDLVEGWVQPDSRVDVLFTYADARRGKRTRTLVPAVQILSVNGQTAQQFRASPGPMSAGSATVSLLVRTEEARKVSLARELGALTLALLGDQEIPGQDIDPRPIDFHELIGTEDPQPAAEETQGTAIVNGDNGRPILYELGMNGRWKRRLS